MSKHLYIYSFDLMKKYFAHVRTTFFTPESSCSGFWPQLDSWSVILNGSVEVTYPEGRTEILCMGNSFGVSPTMEKEYMKGVMKTKVDDCQVGSHWWTLFDFHLRLVVKRTHEAQTCNFLLVKINQVRNDKTFLVFFFLIIWTEHYNRWL